MLAGKTVIDVTNSLDASMVGGWYHATGTCRMTGNAYIRSVENCFVGSLHKVGNASITPAPDASCKPLPDPFAAYPRPAVGSCDYNNFSVSGNKTMTIQPGVYCGGMPSIPALAIWKPVNALATSCQVAPSVMNR